MVDKLNSLLDGAFQFNFARRYFLRPPPVDHLDMFAAGQAFRDAAGVLRDIPAAASGFNLSDALTIILCP